MQKVWSKMKRDIFHYWFITKHLPNPSIRVHQSAPIRILWVMEMVGCFARLSHGSGKILFDDMVQECMLDPEISKWCMSLFWKTFNLVFQRTDSIIRLKPQYHKFLTAPMSIYEELRMAIPAIVKKCFTIADFKMLHDYGFGIVLYKGSTYIWAEDFCCILFDMFVFILLF